MDLFSSKLRFQDRDGQEYASCDKYYPNCKRILCWEVVNSNEGRCMGLRIEKVSQEQLEVAELWDSIPKEHQKIIQDIDAGVKAVHVERMEHARKNRRTKYEGIPSDIPCTKCGAMIHIAPSYLVMRAKSNIPSEVEDWYKKNFVCKKCNPNTGRKGRAPDPELVGIPRKIKCSKCEREVNCNPRHLLEKAKEQGVTWQEYVKKYLCRSCDPNWGSWLKGKRGRGRKRNPAYDGIPKEVKCTGCKKNITVVPKQFMEKADRMGISTDELAKSYKCRSCGGRLPKHTSKRKAAKKGTQKATKKVAKKKAKKKLVNA